MLVISIYFSFLNMSNNTQTLTPIQMLLLIILSLKQNEFKKRHYFISYQLRNQKIQNINRR